MGATGDAGSFVRRHWLLLTVPVIVAALGLGVFAGPWMAGPAATVSTAAHRAGSCPTISARLGLHYPYSNDPENSLTAIDAAHRIGVRKVEVDVWFSKDGVPVDIHDRTVNRTTAYTGRVSAYLAAQLQAMRLKVKGIPGDRAMSSQYLPSVRSALGRAKADGMAVSVELKPRVLTKARARALVGLFGMVNDQAMVDVRSIHPRVLAEMREAGYRGRLTLITAGYKPLPESSGYWMESINYGGSGRHITAAEVAALHASGVLVDAWTPDTAAEVATVPAGVDQVTTNNVRGYRADTDC